MAIANPRIWAAENAARLRETQGALDLESPENRQKYMVDQIRQALRAIPKPERGDYVAALSLHFPELGQQRTQMVTEVRTVTRDANLDEARAEDLFKAFLRKSGSLTGAQKQAFAEELVRSGVVPKPAAPTTANAGPPRAATSGGEVAIPPELRARLGCESADAQRAVTLAADLLSSFDKAVAPIWHFAQGAERGLGMARSLPRKHGSLEKCAQVYLKHGRREDLTEGCAAEVRLAAAVVRALESMLLTFHEPIKQYFDPKNIEAVTERTFMGNLDLEKCWKGYVQRFDGLEPHKFVKKEAVKLLATAIERDLRSRPAAAAEN